MSAPRIGEPFGWRQLNGWEKLRRLLGKIPNILPYTASIEVSIAETADVFTETTGTGTVLIPPECEFYVLATSIANARVGDDTATISPFDPFNDPEGYIGKVTVIHEQGGFRWSNAPVRVGHMFGRGDRPYFWPAPWIVPGGTTLRATVTNRQPGVDTNRLLLSFHGFKRFNTDAPIPTDFLLGPRLLDVIRRSRYRHGERIRVEPYVYALNFDELSTLPDTFSPRPPHGIEQKTFSVSEADFAIVDQLGTVESVDNDAPGIDDRGGTTCRLTLDVGKRRVDDRAVPVVSIFGSARRPFRYAYPLVIPRGGNLTAFLQFNFTSILFGSDRAENAYLTFVGARIFPETLR